MRLAAPFRADDLVELDERLLSRAARVVPLYDVHKGDHGIGVVGLRHDVDDNPGSFDTALEFARWEFARGYSSTYFLLHSASYWPEALVRAGEFVEFGHEVAIHVNAIAVALVEDRNPHTILAAAISDLRATGVDVRGCVAHGDRLCHSSRFVNDEMFLESARPNYGPPDRILRAGDVVLELRPASRAMYALEYDANWLPRDGYLSDSGGHWSRPFDEVVRDLEAGGHLQVLIHPDWWSYAFAAGVPA